MARAAELIEENDRLRAGLAPGGLARAFRRLRAKQAGQRKPQHAESADLEQVPARVARGGISRTGEAHGQSKWTNGAGSKFKVRSSEFKVPGSGFRVPG